MKRFLTVSALLLASAGAQAACQCMCSGGQNRPFCTSTMDLPPLCAPIVCPLAPPSLAPLQAPGIPPLGTQQCRQVQVLNPYTGQYDWRTVCQ